jgi:glyoxylase-like metal-dependent hydrolase (beta-lactamase superfamily II)
MREVARGVWQLSGFPPNAFNVYLVGDVVIDTATRWARRRILRQLGERALSLVALTHCHPDHQGMAKALCEKYGVPLACHEADVAAMEGRQPMIPQRPRLERWSRFWKGPPYPVERVLRDGDEIAGFRVVHTPGHTPGHVVFFREADRVAIAGDVLANIHFLKGTEGLREPPAVFSADPELNRQSMQTLVQLRPEIVCFGHGPPLRERGLLEAFVAQVHARGRVSLKT